MRKFEYRATHDAAPEADSMTVIQMAVVFSWWCYILQSSGQPGCSRAERDYDHNADRPNCFKLQR
jgi:hypothetical protein